jgi:hypothetical protein
MLLAMHLGHGVSHSFSRTSDGIAPQIDHDCSQFFALLPVGVNYVTDSCKSVSACSIYDPEDVGSRKSMRKLPCCECFRY